LRIIACLASSVDGKITAAQLPPSDWVKLGSSADLTRLFTVRNQADVILFGLTTFNAWPGVRWSLVQQAQPETQRIAKRHVVLTQSWQFTPEALIVLEQWQPQWQPFMIVSSTPPPEWIAALLKRNPNVQWFNIPHQETMLYTLVAWLEQQANTQTLLVEGGGQVVAQFLTAQLVQELYLTITPWLIGGSQTPSLVGGEGFTKGTFPKLQWQSVDRVGDELFVHATIEYPDTHS
jgi:2,5-diamino-6-(ribosylamino)-4(3H)-pyrimidinone 5'-phosphate reductase